MGRAEISQAGESLAAAGGEMSLNYFQNRAPVRKLISEMARAISLLFYLFKIRLAFVHCQS